jgi:general secretion pathway protein G
MQMSSRKTTDRRPAATLADDRRGFTMVELLVVVVIIAILLALLLPAINAAIRQARNAQVSSEIQGLATALTQFKSTYNDYPPSRMYLNECGYYPVGNTSTMVPNPMSDITLGQLAQRSLRYLQKFWPRASFSSSGPTGTAAFWHDFNGNGTFDLNGNDPSGAGGFIIQGHQCLTFFLGGIPYNTGSGIGLSGFSKNPANPFMNNINGSVGSTGTVMFSTSRTAPLFEFKSDRLAFYTDPNLPGLPLPPSTTVGAGSGIPGYLDPLKNDLSPGEKVNFYAYFSSYGGAYDPNDVNFGETDLNTGAAPLVLSTNVNFTCFGSGGTTGIKCMSASPNPYTSSLTTVASANSLQTSVFQNPNTFQIISSGSDGQYGIGGQWTQQGESNLPYDPTATNANDPGVRKMEVDNLSNFSSGKLGS